MTLTGLNEITLKDLFDAQQATIDQASEIQKLVMDELLQRHSAAFKSALSAKNKEHGEVSSTIGGIGLTFKIDKKITWDQTQLQSVLESRPDLLHKVIKAKFEVPEKVFDALTEESVLHAIKAARTVETRAPKISFKKSE